jgi:hypothetical protein
MTRHEWNASLFFARKIRAVQRQARTQYKGEINKALIKGLVMGISLSMMGLVLAAIVLIKMYI